MSQKGSVSSGSSSSSKRKSGDAVRFTRTARLPRLDEAINKNDEVIEDIRNGSPEIVFIPPVPVKASQPVPSASGSMDLLATCLSSVGVPVTQQSPVKKEGDQKVVYSVKNAVPRTGISTTIYKSPERSKPKLPPRGPHAEIQANQQKVQSWTTASQNLGASTSAGTVRHTLRTPGSPPKISQYQVPIAHNPKPAVSVRAGTRYSIPFNVPRPRMTNGSTVKIMLPNDAADFPETTGSPSRAKGPLSAKAMKEIMQKHSVVSNSGVSASSMPGIQSAHEFMAGHQMLAQNPLMYGYSTVGHSNSLLAQQMSLPVPILPIPFTLTEAPVEPVAVLPADAENDDDGGMIHGDTYDQYAPCKLALGMPHPDPIVETLSLASVSPPDITYRLRMPEHIGDEGLLSSLQLEAIVYACQRHETFLGDKKSRGGYLIGDGAGVGKGRTIAGIIYENWLRGRKKAIWLSVSSDLKFDAERDLEDIGASEIPVFNLTKTRYAPLSRENGNVTKGVLFATYPGLIGESQFKGAKCGTRMKQILKWCGKNFDGVLVFDECHRAKNLCPGSGQGGGTKTGKAVLEIQQILPGARVIYASATGASEPRNMAYMTRLGLWGDGTPFKEFPEFCASIERRGVGAMEMIAMDMKLRGLYIARQLSFAGVSFDIREIPMDLEYRTLYDDCVDLWTFAREKFAAAALLFQADARLLKHMWGQFWGAHQRFFKYICLSSKVKATVKLAKDAIQDGKCVVIGLQSTGEARTLEQLEDNNGVINEFVSTAKAVFQSLMDKHFPAFDRRKAFETVGMTDMLEDEAEDALDIDPNEEQNGNRRGRKRKAVKAVTSYKVPGTSDLELSFTDDDEPESGPKPSRSSRSQRLTDKKPPQKTSSAKRKDKKLSGKKKKPSRTVNRFKKSKDSSSSEASDFVPSGSSSGSDESDAASGNVSDEEKKKQGSSSEFESEGSACSEDDNPWQRFMAEQRRQQKLKKKQRKAMPVPVKMETEDISLEENPVVVKSAAELREELQMLKQQLMDRFLDLSLRLPTNTLDDLIDQLGGPEKVSEMTGRKGRVVTTAAGSVTYEARNECDVALELLNLAEKSRFMDGEKLIAIISEAASSGISIQADRRAKNQRRRVHITLELPWSADKAIQQFGRTHRSNQVSAPEYVFLITDLAGEKRFAAAVARRLESLGALTHGDRRANSDARDLSAFNIDNKYGRLAVEEVLKASSGLMSYGRRGGPANYEGDYFGDAFQAMVDVGFLARDKPDQRYHLDKVCFAMGKFLNRLLGMKVDMQNAMFEYFATTMDSLIENAKKEGRYEMGILELGFGGTEVREEKKVTVIGTTEWSKAPAFIYTISVERGLSWDDAKDILNEYDDKNSGFYLSNQVLAGKHSIWLAVLKSGQTLAKTTASALNKRIYCIYRPNSGMQLRTDTFEEIKRKGNLVSLDAAKPVWEGMYESMARRCVHAYWAGNCKVAKAGHLCDIGLRRRTYTVLSGSLLSVWEGIGSVLYRGGGAAGPGGDKVKRIQNVRVRLQNNTRIVGIIVPNGLVEHLMETLKMNGSELKETILDTIERLSDSSDDEDAVKVKKGEKDPEIKKEAVPFQLYEKREEVGKSSRKTRVKSESAEEEEEDDEESPAKRKTRNSSKPTKKPKKKGTKWNEDESSEEEASSGNSTDEEEEASYDSDSE